MDANALGRMRVRIHSYILSDAFASLSAFTKISRILCVRIRIPDRILTPVISAIHLCDYRWRQGEKGFLFFLFGKTEIVFFIILKSDIKMANSLIGFKNYHLDFYMAIMLEPEMLLLHSLSNISSLMKALRTEPSVWN